ncbi:MAG: SufS family cysteine desulfurase [Planctomycetes bacterium]|nr:SufS family cysteine desulfurase [Planctomycetota bacterium]
MSYDVDAIRAQFPGLDDAREGKPFAYLDSAATTQKPRCVLDAVARWLGPAYGTVHRGLYRRSVASTQAYEDARATVARFLNADAKEVVFTMGTTDAINLVAWSWGRSRLKPGDQVLVTGMEHHADIVPWQVTAPITGAELVACPLLDDGSLDEAAFDRLLASGRVKLVGLVHIANSLGTVNPVRRLAAKARAAGATVLIDAAQSAPHVPLDVATLGCDFLAFSGHKVYGPTGIGVLWGRGEVLESMPPWRGGGEMIERVSFERTTFAAPPARFEAGTPPIVEAIALATALEWLMAIGLEAVAAHEHDLFTYAEGLMAQVPGLRRIGTAPERAGVLSFTLPGAHPADIAAVLDMENVAIRAGHHCAQPVMARFGVPATARASLGCYTTRADLDRLAAGLHKAVKLFG